MRFLSHPLRSSSQRSQRKGFLFGPFFRKGPKYLVHPVNPVKPFFFPFFPYPAGFSLKLNPIFFLGFSGGVIKARMASKTTLKLSSYFFSRAASLRARSLWEAIISLSLTKARMIWRLTSIARSLFSTDESMATHCSLKAKGKYLRPPR